MYNRYQLNNALNYLVQNIIQNNEKVVVAEKYY